MNDESLMEAREKTKELLSHFLNVWVVMILLSVGALILSFFTVPVVVEKVLKY